MAAAGIRDAAGFLTRLPVGRPGGAPGLAGAAGYFPLVGAAVAAVGIGVWAAVNAVFGPLAAAVVSVLATVAVTGALHEDALADTFDGLWGGSTPARRLEIMRDSRLGTYGAVALVGDLLLRVTLLVPLDVADVARMLVAGHVVGRAAPLVLVAWLRPARPGGQGARLGAVSRSGTVGAGVTVAAALAVTTGPWAPLILAAAFVPVALLRRAAHRRLGGFTGDVLGAGVLLVNLAAAAAVAALVRLEAV